jgi:HEAT repeat protein
LVASTLAPVVLRLTDGSNEPVPDERVWLSFTQAGARETSPVSETLTDALGLARAEITLPATAGRIAVRATAVNVAPQASDDPSLHFEVTALPRPSDLERLVADVRSADHRTRYHAAQALGDLGPLAISTVPTLRFLAGGNDAGIRKQALAAMARIDPRAALPLVLPGLRGDTIGERIDAAQYLAIMGPAAAPAVDELARLLRTNRNSGDWGPRLTALEALQRIGKDAAPAVPTLITVLGDPNPDLRKRAIHCLIVIGSPAALPAAPALRKLLSDPSIDVRESAKRALPVLGGVAGGQLVIASGDGAAVRPYVPTELSVRLTDDDARPRAHQRVFFQVTAGAATLADPSSITDQDGRARISLIGGTPPGPIAVEARYESMTVAFRLHGTR